MREHPIVRLWPAALILMLSGCVAAPVNVDQATGAAVRGHDMVAYHTRGEAVPGSAEYSTRWRGAEWRFASAEHRQRFEADPERYAPAYNGFCAWAMSEDRLVPGEPEYWEIHAGRLFLNCNQRAQDTWEAERDTRMERADRNWAAMGG
jgi:YHS domain-containing protein